jgi:hypothetical protein
MTMTFRTIALAAALMGLAACATSTPAYMAASSPNAVGYSERQIETNRYFVSYRADGADAALLQDYALLRAADLTLQNNHDWFWVDRRTVDGQTARSGPSIGIGLGGGSFGSHTGVGGGVGFNIPIGHGGGPLANAATLEIRFGEGAKPDDANAYDAHATSASLRARLQAPR